MYNFEPCDGEQHITSTESEADREKTGVRRLSTGPENRVSKGQLSNVTDSDIIYGSVARSNPKRSEELALAAARTIGDNQCHHLVVLDMTRLTALFDYHVIATGTSGRQLRAVAEEIEKTLKTEFGESKLSLAGKDDGHWIILDFGTIVVHLFDEETRAFYSLENLWAEAQKVDISEVVPSRALEESLDD